MAILEYKCPNCDGAIRFDSSTQKMTCPFCDAEFDVETLEQYQATVSEAPADAFNWSAAEHESRGELGADEVINYSCPACAGEIFGDVNMAATHCPYCGNPVVIAEKIGGTNKPDYVMPFKLDKESAKAALRNYLRNKPLLPSLFKSDHRIDSITGIYVPFWLFDCGAHADIRYRAEKIRTWSDRSYDYTEHSYFHVGRSGDLGFEKIPVDGSAKLDDAYMEAIEPFDYTALEPFQTAYLAGYAADKYDVDAESGKQRVNERIRQSIEKALSDTVTGYSSVQKQHSTVQVSSGTVAYALLPVWMLNTKFGGETYVFAMNGQSGKFVGRLPVSRSRMWLWFSGLFVALSAVSSVVCHLLMR